MLVTAGLAVLGICLAGCSSDQRVAIQTDPPSKLSQPCLLVGFGGVLVPDPTFGLALAGTGVVWPNGYSAQRQDGKIVILDERGNVVAREGDKVIMGNPPFNGLVHPCTPIDVETPRPS